MFHKLKYYLATFSSSLFQMGMETETFWTSLFAFYSKQISFSLINSVFCVFHVNINNLFI